MKKKRKLKRSFKITIVILFIIIVGLTLVFNLPKKESKKIVNQPVISSKDEDKKQR